MSTPEIKATLAALQSSGQAFVFAPTWDDKARQSIAIARKLKPRVTVLLAAAWSDLRPTLRAWQAFDLAEKAWYVAVDVAGADSSQQDNSPAAFGCLVATSATALAVFLESPAQEQVVILATYPSAAAIGQGLQLAGQRAQLGIFDEVHRSTTGDETIVSAAIDACALPIDRRVFLTEDFPVEVPRVGIVSQLPEKALLEVMSAVALVVSGVWWSVDRVRRARGLPPLDVK
jgi:hypothetical protein